MKRKIRITFLVIMLTISIFMMSSGISSELKSKKINEVINLHSNNPMDGRSSYGKGSSPKRANL